MERFNGHLQRLQEVGLKDPKCIYLQNQAPIRRQLWEGY